MQELVRNWITHHQDQLVELAKDLVAVPSENTPPTGREKRCQEIIAEFLRELGASIDLFEPTEVPGLTEHPGYWPGREYRDRPNLVAMLPGVGKGRSLLFGCHVDVVKASYGGRFDPFDPVIYQGRLYGRGACDMKGGIAAALTAIQCLRSLGIELQGDIVFESVVDEEMGGANGTLAACLKGYGADLALIPEPNNLTVSPAHRGGATWRIEVKGKGGMGFGGEDIANPAYLLAELVKEIWDYELSHKNTIGPAPYFSNQPGLPVVLSYVHAGDYPPAEGDGVPTSGSLEVWVECFPGVSYEELYGDFLQPLLDLAASHPEYEVRSSMVTRFLPGTTVDSSHPGIDVVKEALEWSTSSNADIVGSPFACDAFVYNIYSDTPAVILGPRGGNAHADDEYVEINSLIDLTTAYAVTAMKWCGGQ